MKERGRAKGGVVARQGVRIWEGIAREIAIWT